MGALFFTPLWLVPGSHAWARLCVSVVLAALFVGVALRRHRDAYRAFWRTARR